MTARAADVLAKARGQLGYTEGPGDNENIFSTHWGKPPQPWCADYATWALQQGGALDVPQSSYTPTLAQHYQDASRWGQAPRIGALVFFRFTVNGTKRIAHVGIVESIREDGSIVTLEGNTDSAGGRTGGRVMRKVRSANIAGYGYPQYAPPLRKKPAEPERDVPSWWHRTIARGMQGADVRHLEHHYKLPLTNRWSSDLERKVRADRIRYQLDLSRGNTCDRALARILKKEGAR